VEREFGSLLMWEKEKESRSGTFAITKDNKFAIGS